jgi:hypothetical protein
MESKLATAAKNALLATSQRLTPEERLNAFLAHSRLMMELQVAGLKLREAAKPTDRARRASSASASKS